MTASAKTFFNYTDLDFTGKDGARWDGVEYAIKAGEKVMLQDYIADHLAEHLTMRELNRKNKDALINRESASFQELKKRCFAEETVEAETPEKLEMLIARPKKKLGLPKKVKEVEFPDLKK